MRWAADTVADSSGVRSCRAARSPVTRVVGGPGALAVAGGLLFEAAQNAGMRDGDDAVRAARLPRYCRTHGRVRMAM